jgi:polysaccharide export outer membrane protein
VQGCSNEYAIGKVSAIVIILLISITGQGLPGSIRKYFFVFLLCLLALASCQSAKVQQSPFVPMLEPDMKVTFAPGDEIEVKFFYVPELNEIQTVRPDGKITLQLVGEVIAQGKTPIELKNELINLYESELKNPEVAVFVRSLSNQRVYVGGEVNAPGVIELPRATITVLEAIIQAGGFNMELANVEKVVVIRQKGEKYYKTFLNYKEALEGKEKMPVFHLEPLDIVYIPRTTIAKVNQWIEQHINRIIPFGTTITTTRGRTTLGIEPPGSGER